MTINVLGNVVAIIQARMGSERLPGKMLAKISNISVIDWVITRSMLSKNCNRFVLATTNLPEDDILAAKAKQNNCDTYRGHEKNVLLRYFEAADEYKANTVVRICGDRPFICPELIDFAIKEYEKNGSDITFNHISGSGVIWPRGFGVEVFSINFLKKLNDHVVDQSEREHVTLHAWNNRDQYKLISTPRFGEFKNVRKEIKLDLDTIDDLNLLNHISNSFSIRSSGNEILKEYFKCNE